jgi:hypothetical protein
MPSLRVIAPLVLVRGEQGRIHHCYENAVIDVIDADHATYLLEQGMVVAVDGTRQTPVTADRGEPDQVEVGGGDPAVDHPRPPHVAAKERWIDYAVSQGFDASEAAEMTKAQLIAALS